MRHHKIIVLGPCCKLNKRTGLIHAPFAAESRSGKFLRMILKLNQIDEGDIEFDNIISTAVFDESGKECNPTVDQLVPALVAHRIWKEADVIIALSASVRTAFEMTKRVEPHISKPTIHFLAHPSYVLRRPQIERSAFVRDFTAALLAPASSPPRVAKRLH